MRKLTDSEWYIRMFGYNKLIWGCKKSPRAFKGRNFILLAFSVSKKFKMFIKKI